MQKKHWGGEQMATRRELLSQKMGLYYNQEIENSVIPAQEQNAVRNLWNKQLEVTQHFVRDDFVASVATQRTGILGMFVILVKRLFRKGTYYIFKQFGERVYAFQSRCMELIGQLIQCYSDLGEKQKGQTDQLSELQIQVKEQSKALSDEIEALQKAIKQIKKEQASIPELEELKKNNMEQQRQINFLCDKIREVQGIEQINAGAVNRLEEDINCLREIDGELFSKREESFFDKRSTSQAGEDGIIAYIASMLGYQQEEVTYLDLGANHARELSNTYCFYKKGTQGVLVEANPNLIPELKLLRPRDTVLNFCVSDSDDETVDFYLVNGDGISSKSKESVDHATSVNEELKVIETVQVKTISVNHILEQYFDECPFLLNVDIEGSDIEVFRSLDFERYRPVVIVAETIPYQKKLVVGKKDQDIVRLLESKDYVEYAFTGINSVFIDRRLLSKKHIL